MADHVFICYAREDQDFVLKLSKNLKEKGVPVWLDQWDIPAGANWNRTINEALYECAKFLIVLSPKAVDSEEVEGEWITAKNEKKPIIPILYRQCRIPRQLQLFHHINFTSCEPDDSAALEQILSVLKVAVSASAEPTMSEAKREEEIKRREKERGKAEDERQPLEEETQRLAEERRKFYEEQQRLEAIRKAEEQRKQKEAEAKRKAKQERKRKKAEAKRKAETARDETLIAYSNGVVLDTKTDLEWVAGSDTDTTWYEAKSSVESLTIDGGGWRIPTLDELETLYKKGVGTRNMTPLLETTGWWVWSSEVKDWSSAWGFYFRTGSTCWSTRFRSDNSRAFAVRSRR